MKSIQYILLLVVTALLAVGLSPRLGLAQTETDSALTVAQLQNATYSGIYDEPVTLVDGQYEGEPFTPDSASRPVVSYLGEAFGDLDGDGVEDAAVFLVENSGGTGDFVYVAVN
jgi:hypothetical protein